MALNAETPEALATITGRGWAYWGPMSRAVTNQPAREELARVKVGRVHKTGIRIKQPNGAWETVHPAHLYVN